tara:strand:+ start:1186 stop:1761 length:576 start_codon:yes stop_codon:yes gene_type:complete
MLINIYEILDAALVGGLVGIFIIVLSFILKFIKKIKNGGNDKSSQKNENEIVVNETIKESSKVDVEEDKKYNTISDKSNSESESFDWWWITKRKKNISLSLILLPLLKVLTHFFLFPNKSEVVVDRIYNPNPSATMRDGGARYWNNIMGYENNSLGSHFEVMFTERIELFVPVTIVFLVVVWFFNDKIKAQ